MDPRNQEQAKFALVREMMDTVDVIKNFDPNVVEPYVAAVKKAGQLFLTGEGSSRIFPAKHAIAALRQWGADFPVATEGGRQAMEYNLTDWAIFCASNSGKTKEMVALLSHLQQHNHNRRFGLTAQQDTPLEKLCERTHVLSCGWENAVAATKSVVEQSLFYYALVFALADKPFPAEELAEVGDAMQAVLTADIPDDLIARVASAKRIYFAGRNDGVAEELTLKTNEITRLPSAFLEGTYAVHGIEEVMNKNEVVIVVDPYESELDKFQEVLDQGVGLTLVAISDKALSVPTVTIPQCNGFSPYLQLAAGWNILVDVGLANQIDLDTPVRARKVGNEA